MCRHYGGSRPIPLAASFFFNDTATTEIYTLSLHDALPIYIAMAANRVILTTERIVSNDQIRRSPDQTKIPFFTVEAVVEVPFGSAPHECYGLYEPFFDNLDAYAAMTRQDAARGVTEYLERYFYEPASWADYLGLLGIDSILDASRRGRSHYND